jgi:hypothetical protein
MSKATYKSLQRARRLAHEEVGQTKLERAIELYGKEDGRVMYAVHEMAISSVGTFSERLEMCNEIIELSK